MPRITLRVDFDCSALLRIEGCVNGGGLREPSTRCQTPGTAGKPLTTFPRPVKNQFDTRLLPETCAGGCLRQSGGTPERICGWAEARTHRIS